MVLRSTSGGYETGNRALIAETGFAVPIPFSEYTEVR